MRTLTLGVLIVSGGTLAALPFRRYQAIPDASASPVQVTGPSQSALDSPQLDKPESGWPAVRTASDQLPVDSDFVVASQRHWAQPYVPPERNSVDIPLTYEDLAQPIDLPSAIAHRFNATAQVREQRHKREQAVELVMPPMESLAVAQQQELERAMAAASAKVETGGAAGVLASSTTSRVETVRQLPEAAPATPERHWIRQPN